MSSHDEPARRARPGPIPRYTRETILEAALELIDRGPAEAFSMRRLADELGIAAMTLYGYVEGKDDILQGCTLLAFSQFQEPLDPGAPWQDEIRVGARNLYRICRLHPNLATLVVGHRATAPGLFRTRERILELLLDTGFDEAAALQSMGAIAYYALGFATGAAGYEPLPPLDVGDFPRLTELADRYEEHASDEAFERGLSLLIDGLAAQTSR